MDERNIMLLAVLAIAVIVIGSYIMPSGIEGTSADKVDDIPEIDLNTCLTQIKIVNPEISQQAAMDNCYTIEAVNRGDAGLCERVSASFRPNCLAQF